MGDHEEPIPQFYIKLNRLNLLQMGFGLLGVFAVVFRFSKLCGCVDARKKAMEKKDNEVLIKKLNHKRALLIREDKRLDQAEIRRLKTLIVVLTKQCNEKCIEESLRKSIIRHLDGSSRQEFEALMATVGKEFASDSDSNDKNKSGKEMK